MSRPPQTDLENYVDNQHTANQPWNEVNHSQNHQKRFINSLIIRLQACPSCIIMTDCTIYGLLIDMRKKRKLTFRSYSTPTSKSHSTHQFVIPSRLVVRGQPQILTTGVEVSLSRDGHRWLKTSTMRLWMCVAYRDRLSTSTLCLEWLNSRMNP